MYDSITVLPSAYIRRGHAAITRDNTTVYTGPLSGVVHLQAGDEILVSPSDFTRLRADLKKIGY
jgi:hypothetical protein